MENKETYTAFEGSSKVAHGSLREVVLKVKKKIGQSNHSQVLILSDGTGKTFDFNFQGTDSEVQKRLEVFVSAKEEKLESGPGRPKMGVISREISLLPRHWEWLANQSAGASGTIRNLVEDAMKKSLHQGSLKQQQEKTYRIMTVLAGDQVGYEEALRALYKRDHASFVKYTSTWSKDLRLYLEKMTQFVFKPADKK